MYFFNVDLLFFDEVGDVGKGVKSVEVISIDVLYVGDVVVDDF